jgi:hypothetical protein
MSDEADFNVEWLRDAQRVYLEPGDILVIIVKEELTCDEFDHLQLKARSEFPNNRVVVFQGDIDIGVIAK